MVKCKDIPNSQGYGTCDKDVNVERTLPGGTEYSVKCSDGHVANISIADWNVLVNMGRLSILPQLERRMQSRAEDLLSKNVDDKDIISDIVIKLGADPGLSGTSTDQLKSAALRILSKAKKRRGEITKEVSDIFCPECRAKKLVHVKDKKNNIEYYYCSDSRCLAHPVKLSPYQVREKERVYWIGERDRVRKDLKDRLRNNAITKDQHDRLLTNGLAIIDERERRASRPMMSYFKRKGSFNEFKRHYGAGLSGRIRDSLGMGEGVMVKARKRAKRQLRDLRLEYDNRNITKQEWKMGKKRIKERYERIKERYREKEREAKKERNLEGNAFTRWSESWFGGAWGGHVMQVISVLAMIIGGMIVSQLIEGTWAGSFTLGFLMLGVSTMLPGYREVEGFDKIALNLKPQDIKRAYKVISHIRHNPHTGSSFIKSALKFFAVYFFVTGANNSTVIGWLSNIVMIIVAALAYFSFSTKYDPNVPGQIFEAVGRFFIGIIVIPWMVFYGIFQSFVLGLMATAFFAVPPVATKESGEGEKVMLGEYGRWIFAIIMLFALFGSGIMPVGEILFGLPTWGLTGALRSTFLYFWLVTFIAGFFSPASQRPAIGFIMLAAATMIYAVGPGTQQVGSALLGPWFGKAFVALTDAMAPVTEAFNQIGNTFGMAFQMIFNPVGFAQGIMTGTYSKDPETGLIGAYGVEVGNFRTTPIYAGLPYSIIIPIENKGSAEAKNIEVMLLAGTGISKTKKGEVVTSVQNIPKSETTYWKPVDINIPYLAERYEKVPTFQRDALSMTDIGITQANLKKSAIGSTITYECNTDSDPDLDDKSCTAELVGRTLIKQDSEQIFFSSLDTGIPCSSVVKFGLMEAKGSKFLPFTVLVSYDYSVESILEIEAISQDEWSRLAQESQLFPGMKKPSTMKNSPAMLNIDTLEQPIREGTPFLIAFNLTPAIPGTGWIEFNEDEEQQVVLELSPALMKYYKDDSCTTKPSNADTTKGILTWNSDRYPIQEHAIICNLGAMPVEEGTPTQTYYIRAYADFRYNEITTKAFALEFGGIRCCRGDKDPEHLREDCIGQNVQCINKECKAGSDDSTTTGGPVDQPTGGPVDQPTGDPVEQPSGGSTT